MLAKPKWVDSDSVCEPRSMLRMPKFGLSLATLSRSLSLFDLNLRR